MTMIKSGPDMVCYKCNSVGSSEVTRDNVYSVVGLDTKVTETVRVCSKCGEVLFDDVLERVNIDNTYKECYRQHGYIASGYRLVDGMIVNDPTSKIGQMISISMQRDM